MWRGRGSIVVWVRCRFQNTTCDPVAASKCRLLPDCSCHRDESGLLWANDGQVAHSHCHRFRYFGTLTSLIEVVAPALGATFCSRCMAPECCIAKTYNNIRFTTTAVDRSVRRSPSSVVGTTMFPMNPTEYRNTPKNIA